MKKRVIIVGGGAAGLFTAILCAEQAPHLEIIVLEKTRHLLSKVKVSGGGRCNVTHAEFDPQRLISYYPRGSKELLGPFHRFQPRDTIAWFQAHGVILKTEEDGRVFPSTDHSGTIMHCLLEAARAAHVSILTEASVRSIQFLKEENSYKVHLENREPLVCDALVLATGGSPEGYRIAQELGHRILTPIPSLFTLNIPSFSLSALSGISLMDTELSLPQLGYKERGPLLITHFGFSGPAALRLSAFAARALYDCAYKTLLEVNWIPSHRPEEVLNIFLSAKREKPSRLLSQEHLFPLPSALWRQALSSANIPLERPLGHLSETSLKQLARWLTTSSFRTEGRTTHKAEFVTCGGVCLKEVDFKTMQSKLLPRLFFVGEVLDIDGVTGGFNFQNAWTTAYLAASALSGKN